MGVWQHMATMPEQIAIRELRDNRDITPGKSLERPIRRYPPTGQMTASDALEEDRADR